MIYEFRNRTGDSSIDLEFTDLVEDLKANKVGSLHFFEGTQVAISFFDGMPVLQLNQYPKVPSIVNTMMLGLAMAMRDAQVCTKAEFELIYNRAARLHLQQKEESMKL